MCDLQIDRERINLNNSKIDKLFCFNNSIKDSIPILNIFGTDSRKS